MSIYPESADPKKIDWSARMFSAAGAPTKIHHCDFVVQELIKVSSLN